MTAGTARLRPRLGDLLRSVQSQLAAGGIEDAAREARRLIAAVGELAPEALIAHPEHLVAQADAERIAAGVERRLAGEPLGRIVGERDFYGRAFKLNAATLEPRGDSEVLVDAVLEIVHQTGAGRDALRIVDVGTGTGCLLVTLLAELPAAVGLGVDIAPQAVEAARENAVRHRVDGRAGFVVGDGLDGVAGPFDILVSNPPYIRRDDIPGLSDDVRRFDPHLALDGGPDGLDLYRRISDRAGEVVPHGWVFFEIGAGMRDDVLDVCNTKLGSVAQWRVWRDLNGHDRCVARMTRLPTGHE